MRSCKEDDQQETHSKAGRTGSSDRTARRRAVDRPGLLRHPGRGQRTKWAPDRDTDAEASRPRLDAERALAVATDNT